MKKIYEFLLWNNCGNNCTFCHQRDHERKNLDKILNPTEQIDSIQKCSKFLKDQFEKGNHILLCGGELFDVVHPDVIKEMKALLDQVLQMMLAEEIDLLYLNTNLLYKDLDLLETFLKAVDENSLFERLKFTTSYDVVGRFCNSAREQLFYRNLKYLTVTYKDIKVVVNTVLTKEACKRIREDRFGADYLLEYNHELGKDNVTLKEWKEYFGVEMNTIPNIILNYSEAPDVATKNEVFGALIHLDSIIPGYLESYAKNISLKQEKLLYEYNKTSKEYIFCSSKIADCGHSVNFRRSFADSDDCFPCQLMKLYHKKG